MQERIRIDEGKEDEDRRERSSEECNETRDESRLLLGELIDVLVRDRVGEVDTTLEEVGEFVEFAKVPARELCKLTRSNRGWVLVILLRQGIRTR
jgi:hypothetical protein